MPVKELTPELWGHIFSFCAEKGDEGVFTPQPTLVNALRVNSTLFLAAAPHLYRSPIVYNIASFFLGAGDSIPMKPKRNPNSSFSDSSRIQDLDHPQAGNTKLPALRHVRKLTIVPSPKTCLTHDADTWPEDEDNSTKKKRIGKLGKLQKGTQAHVLEQERYLDQAHRILSSLSPDQIVTPNLQCLTLGTCLWADCRAAETVLDSFALAVNSFRPLLWTSCRPTHWCEYNLDSRSEVRSMDIQDGILPKQVTIHNEPGERKGFPVYWGTRNRIMVRLFTDVCPDDDPREKSRSEKNEDEDEAVRQIFTGEVNSPPTTNQAGGSSSAIDAGTPGNPSEEWQDEEALEENPIFSPGGTVDPFFSEAFWDEPMGLKKDDAVDLILRSIKVPYPAWLNLNTPFKAKIDKSTIIEIYGLEKILRGWHQGDRDNLEHFDDIFDDSDSEASSSSDEDMNSNGSWSTLEDQEKTEKKQRRALQKIQDMVMDEMTDGYNNQGWTRKKSPTVKLYLAKEMPKCEACGQGKKDKWVWNPLPERYRKDVKE